MRLIDADEFFKEIVKRCGCIPYVESRKGEAIYLNNLISEQPTAYDVDKVAEELQDLLWDCYTDSGVGIDRESGFKAYEREMERIVKQNRR